MQPATRNDALSKTFFAGRKSKELQTTTLTGILLPFHTIGKKGRRITYTILADGRETQLEFNPALRSIAKKLRWERVQVTGKFNKFTKALKVSKITVADHYDEPTALAMEDFATEDWLEWQEELSRIENREHLSVDTAS